MLVRDPRSGILGSYNWTQKNTHGPRQDTRSKNVGSTNKPHRSKRFCGIPQLLPTIHKRILQVGTTPTRPHKKGGRMEMDAYGTSHLRSTKSSSGRRTS